MNFLNMKIIKSGILFFLCLFIHSLTLADHNKVIFEVRYELKYQPDSTDNKIINSEDMLLWIGMNKSMFFPYLTYDSDSVWNTFEGLDIISRNERSSEIEKGISRFKFYIYKEYSSGNIDNYHHIFGDTYNFNESMNDFKWEMHNEFEDYHGYNCQKASTYFGGRQWEVWFTKEIPISDGPYKFSGLPGLILKARDTRNHYVFELVHIKNAESYKNIYLPDYRPFKVTPCQYFRALKHHQENFAATVAAGTINLDPQKLQEIVERFKKRNNMIELKCD